MGNNGRAVDGNAGRGRGQRWMLNASIAMTLQSCGMRYGVVRDRRNERRRDGVADIEYSWQYGTNEGTRETKSWAVRAYSMLIRFG